MANDNRPKAIYEPGELEKTRRNLGNLDKEEALKMMKTLGGQIGVEKSAPIDYDALPKKKNTIVRSKSSPTQTNSSSRVEPKKNPKKNKETYSLPILEPKVKSYMNEILEDYNIRPKENLFSKIINWALNRHDLVSFDFVVGPLNKYVTNIVKFVNSIKRIVNSAPESVKKHVFESKELSCRFFSKICEYDTELLSKLYSNIRNHANDTSVKSLSTLISTMFQLLYSIYFLGEDRINVFISRMITELKTKTTIPAETLQAYTQESASLCLYTFSEMYKGLYPLLMRLSCKNVSMYPIFYTQESMNILKFLGLSKFDILLPEKEVKEESAPKEEKKQTVEEDREAIEQKSRRGLLAKGLSILNIMFPEAGWKDLSSFPDMYPYFNPFFDFPEPFAYVSPENPLQVTTILIRILDQCFTGCRYIKFQIDETFSQKMDTEKLQEIIDNWGSYSTILFERHYLTNLKEIVNNVDAKVDYTESQFGGRALSNLYWYAKNQFLPLLRFELKFLDTPKADTMLEPIFKQVPEIRKTFEEIIARANKAFAENPENAKESTDLGALKLWGQYHFPMPNFISRRLDVLLGGKKSGNTNNLNLLKYTACILSVLDWWINDTSSPAYASFAACPFRKDDDGHPLFFVQQRSGVDSLFIENLKKKV